MRIPTAAILLLALLKAPADASAGTYDGALAVDLIRGSIAARDCKRAVDRLKSGLSDDHPEVFLLAGSMYENGICVRRDWTRALGFYAQAHEKGETQAVARIVAGYADPSNGPDVGAALWWATKSPNFGFAECAVPKEASADPELFVAALNTWPAARLAACNYMVGVLATITAEVKYPELALTHGVGGQVTLRFLAGVPRIELQRGASREYALLGWVNADTLRDRKTRKLSDGFEAALSAVSNRALQRYPHPDGISADTLIEVPYIFGLDE